MYQEYKPIPEELQQAYEAYRYALSKWSEAYPEHGGCDDFWSSYSPRLAEELEERRNTWSSREPKVPECLSILLAERQKVKEYNYKIDQAIKAEKRAIEDEKRTIEKKILAEKASKQTKENRRLGAIQAAVTRKANKVEKEVQKERYSFVKSTLKLKTQ